MQPPHPPPGPNNPYLQGQPDPYGQGRPGQAPHGHGPHGHAPHGQHPYGHGPAQPPAKKSNRGCWIMVIGGISLMLLIIAGGSYAFYRAVQGTPVGDVMWAVGEGADAINEARSAPGTNALRKAGCSEAMAIEFKRFMKIAERFADAGVSEPPDDMPGTMVTCTLGLLEDTSGVATCHRFAKAYIDGGGEPDRNFMLVVSKNGNNNGVCSELYEADGTHVPGAGNTPGVTP